MCNVKFPIALHQDLQAAPYLLLYIQRVAFIGTMVQATTSQGIVAIKTCLKIWVTGREKAAYKRTADGVSPSSRRVLEASAGEKVFLFGVLAAGSTRTSN